MSDLINILLNIQLLAPAIQKVATDPTPPVPTMKTKLKPISHDPTNPIEANNQTDDKAVDCIAMHNGK